MIHMSVGGSHAGTWMYSPETCGKAAPREIQMIRNTDDVCFGFFFFAIVLKVSVHNSIYIMDNLRLSDVSEKYLHGKKHCRTVRATV